MKMPMNSISDKLCRRRCRVSPHLGSSLVFWRKARRMRQEDLAEASGVSPSTVKWIERGQRKRGPRIDTLEALCDALDVSLEELIGGARRRAHWGDNSTLD